MPYRYLWMLSVLFIAVVSMRYNMSFLAWVMFVPLLILVRDVQGAKGWASVFVLLQIALFLQMLKIITDPVPVMMALLFSVPMAIAAWVWIWIYEKVRRSAGDMLGIFFFASLMSTSEWLSFYTSELGSWGSMTYTQLDDLAFLQMTSLFGITFPSFFLYLSSAFVAVFIVSEKRTQFIKPALITSIVYALFYAYGVIRLEQTAPGEHTRVAAIASDMMITPRGIPDAAYLKEGTETLMESTKIAIERGAQLVAWNEGATIIFKEEEADFVERVKTLSMQHQADLVIAYIVPIEGIKRFENKYLFISNGNVLDEYFKYHPVPGEGAVKGEKIAEAPDLGYAKVSGAICYDFDFPTLGRALSQKKIDLAVVPSSDWRGIDPYHAQMAAVRAIEGGYAVLRPVRGATSIATDAYGRVRASMSYYEANDRILLASLPLERVETLYSKVGDLFPVLLIVFMLFVGYRAKVGTQDI